MCENRSEALKGENENVLKNIKKQNEGTKDKLGEPLLL